MPPECPAEARYSLRFEAIWDRSSHGNQPPFPSNPHFSRLAGATHTAETSFWSPGGIATPGIEVMAETGGTSTLCREIAAANEAGESSPCLTGSEGSFLSPGSVSLAFDATAEHPALTLVSMIAPSPDWFVGVNGLPLMEDGCWRETIDVQLTGYDAGTDGGSTFTAPDFDVTPHEPIGSIRDLPGSVRSRSFAALSLRLLDESS